MVKDVKLNLHQNRVANFPMNLKPNKTTPLPFPQNLEAAQPLATKVKLNPELLDLVGNIKEKKVEKPDKMKMSD
jgi:hypothetical protein